MIGKPKYKFGDLVTFTFNNSNERKTGIIAIIDKYGTFEDNSDASYDILVKDENCLYKHFTEKLIIEKIGEVDPNTVWS